MVERQRLGDENLSKLVAKDAVTLGEQVFKRRRVHCATLEPLFGKRWHFDTRGLSNALCNNGTLEFVEFLMIPIG